MLLTIKLFTIDTTNSLKTIKKFYNNFKRKKKHGMHEWQHVDSGTQFTNYNQLLHVTLRKKL